MAKTYGMAVVRKCRDQCRDGVESHGPEGDIRRSKVKLGVHTRTELGAVLFDAAPAGQGDG
jgi:hypothetical protein